MLDVEINVENPFVVFFPGRSGSTFLVHLLNAHPDVFCGHEVFATVVDENEKHERTVKSREKKLEILESIYTRKKQKKASGFKFKFSSQYEYYPDVYRFFLQHLHKMKMIFLYRENVLKMAISRQNLTRMQQMGEAHFLKADSNTEVGKLHLDLDQAFYFARRQRSDIQFFKRASKVFPHRFVVSYEQLNQNTNETMAEIYEFLGLARPEGAVDAPIKKITKDSLEEAVENYDEMVEYFKKTKLADCLEE